MKFVSLSVTGEDIDEILRDISKAVLDRLGEHADFALVFPSSHFASRAEDLVSNLKSAIGARVMLGCTGEGVIGPAHEIEDQPAVAVVAALLPGVDVMPFDIPKAALINVALNPPLLRKHYAPPVDTRFLVMLADPFSAPMDGVLNAFNQEYENVPIIGGMASGARQPGETVLMVNDRVIREGLVGVSFVGPIQADIIVSQGCRPVGPVFEVTESKNNVIDSLGGESPLLRIQSMLDEMDDEDRDLLRNGLFIGRAIDSGKESLGRGDFLIRGVLGVDSRTGAIAVSDVIDAGERVQFHLRDADTAREDLEMMLSPHALFGEPSGAFLFSCNGRGTRLYEEPDGDINAIRGFFSGLDLAGFFCAGEIGPIGGKNFLHGHTASLALIRPAAPDPRPR
ncbi:MAG: FIST C-terminal domain-containing protein [Candidatus Krumholzibacteria bacterium]|nr:FIST C-terminal domain-containing protein [Candidatus Krumholzibacteria bacterium]MDH4337815.1 FIST C-terminal domain-containing protein [Candidatus Krumholzibacteria bacterium]MDH5271179.1 FIST C-terminal domain-containing protein [Candidatus Krumholzibacteria bacterium]